MTTAVSEPSVIDSLPSASALSAMQALYDDGKLLQSLRLGERSGPIRAWSGMEGRILAGRIAWNLGAPRLARAMHVQAYRENRPHPAAVYYYARAKWERSGPLAAINFCRQFGDLDHAESEIRVDWFALRANLAAAYRDFEAADDLLAKAYEIDPQRPWLCVEQSRVLEHQDRCEEALALARRSMEIQPWFRSGVHAVAHILQLLDRDEEAVALLTEATHHIESAALLWQLASLQDDLRRYGDAQETLSRIDLFSPLKEKRFAQSVATLRSNIACHGGDFTRAIHFARLAENEFMRNIAQKLETRMADGLKDGDSCGRVLLDVPFIRQHHLTCAPATLAAIARFWNRPADHLAMVDAICYDGTPSHSQRSWATAAGWHVREFTLTWEAAVALTERGVPFALTTSQVASAHLQAVVGFDHLRNTLLCRDPSQYYTTEIAFDLLLKYNASSGPRGLVMIPMELADRLDGINLADAEFFDLIYQVEAALARHDRSAAEAWLEKLAIASPLHRLTHHARRAIASYDSNANGILSAIDNLLLLYPGDQGLLYARIYALRTLDRHDLIQPLLQKRCAAKKTDPNFYRLYGEELRRDVGDNAQVVALFKRAVRLRPTDAASLFGLASALWSNRDLEESTALYRFCACIDETNETGSQSYFIASRHLRHTETALGMLQRRFERLGKRSSRPALTLFWALELLDRLPEAMAILERATTLRPDDGDLVLFSASAHTRHGNIARGQFLLESASNKSHRTAWLRCAAQIAAYQAEQKAALALWRQVLDAEPLASDANTQVARLIAETQSPAAANDYLLEQHDRFPHHAGLQQIRINHLRPQGPAAVAPVARELVEHSPGSVWARVELSQALIQLGQPQEALEHARAALRISPHAPNAHYGSV